MSSPSSKEYSYGRLCGRLEKRSRRFRRTLGSGRLAGRPPNHHTIRAGWESRSLHSAAIETLANNNATPTPLPLGYVQNGSSAAPVSPARSPGREMLETEAHVYLRDARRELCGVNADFLPPQGPHVGPGKTTPDNASTWAAARWLEPASSHHSDDLRGRRLAPDIG